MNLLPEVAGVVYQHLSVMVVVCLRPYLIEESEGPGRATNELSMEFGMAKAHQLHEEASQA